MVNKVVYWGHDRNDPTKRLDMVTSESNNGSLMWPQKGMQIILDNDDGLVVFKVIDVKFILNKFETIVEVELG